MVKITVIKNTATYLTILFIIVSLSALAFFTRPPMPSNIDYSQYSSKTVSSENGNQVIGIKAGLGFNPNKILALSYVPTKLRIQTENTFDCTSQVSIPQLNIRQSLPITGYTDIVIPSQQPGTIITGFCSANTYRFDIRFS